MPKARHAPPMAGSSIDMTGPARRLVASVFTLLSGTCPWGRASLRLREAYHFERTCMMEFLQHALLLPDARNPYGCAPACR
jgi:hypothetical protein